MPVWTLPAGFRSENLDRRDSLAERSQFELSGDFAAQIEKVGHQRRATKKGPSGWLDP